VLALTLLRPWDRAILYGNKRVENRTWPCPPSARGKPIALHAGQTYDEDGAQWMHRKKLFDPYAAQVLFNPHAEHRIAIGCIVGVATVAAVAGVRDVLPHHLTEHQKRILASRWFMGPYGWLLADVRALREPVPCKGHQRLWTVPPDVERRVMAQLEVKR
jgi:hypothetical protein